MRVLLCVAYFVALLEFALQTQVCKSASRAKYTTLWRQIKLKGSGVSRTTEVDAGSPGHMAFFAKYLVVCAAIPKTGRRLVLARHVDQFKDELKTYASSGQQWLIGCCMSLRTCGHSAKLLCDHLWHTNFYPYVGRNIGLGFLSACKNHGASGCSFFGYACISWRPYVYNWRCYQSRDHILVSCCFHNRRSFHWDLGHERSQGNLLLL